MDDAHAPPVPLEVLRHESPVAVMGLIFAAEQAAFLDQVSRNRLIDLALLHQIEKARLVRGPVGAQLLVIVEHASWS